MISLLSVTLVALASAAGPQPAETAFAPNVPPPITRKEPALLSVTLETSEVEGDLMAGVEKPTRYKFWTFDGNVPGPFLRVRVGDTLEVHLKNPKTSIMIHNVDFHAVTGPGGGAPLTLTAPGVESVARFKMLHPGLFTYHCAAPPVTQHIANGMYGLIFVEPEGGLPPVDREFYVMQGEFYTKGDFGAEGLQEFSAEKGEYEHPTYIVFNGHVGALQDAGSLKAKVGEKVRIFFGNGGPNLVSSFHVIGAIFDNVYREGSVSDPIHHVQTTLVPPGGGSIVEFTLSVPGNYTLVDHAIFRIQKGAIGTLQATGPDAPEIYQKVK